MLNSEKQPHELRDNYCKYTKKIVPSHPLSKNTFIKTLLFNLIHTIMANQDIFSVTPVTSIELTEQFLTENYELRKNVLSSKLEVRETSNPDAPFRPCTKETINTITIRARKELADEVKNPKSLIEELIHSETVPQHDPIGEYLNHLPAWDGKDRVTELFYHIPGITEEQLGWYHRWMLSSAAHWLKMDMLHGNECVPTLIGAQGCGKSTFWQRLLPPHLREFYLDHLNLANKNDKEMALSNNLLVNLDEIDKYKHGQQADLKQTLSKVKVNGRPIYGREQHERHRYASFVATTNNPHPLQDPTGSRRYLCVQIPDGQLIDNESEIEYDQLYAQVVHELQVNHERYYFTNEEVQAIQLANNRFQKSVDLDDMIDECLRQPEVGERVSPLSIKQIVEVIKMQYPMLNATHALKVHLGRHLVQHGFESKTRNTGSVYFAVPLKAA